MQFKTDEQLRKYLTKRVEFDIGGRAWSFNGIKFTSWAGYFQKDFHTYVNYVCDLRQLSASGYYGYEGYQEIAEKDFNGDNAISECINWVVDRLMEIYKLLNERTAPYLNDKQMYDLMVSRPIVLKEAQ